MSRAAGGRCGRRWAWGTGYGKVNGLTLCVVLVRRRLPVAVAPRLGLRWRLRVLARPAY